MCADASSKQSTNFNPEFIGRKGGSSLGKSDNRRESQNFELMDDFAEMERLAMSVTLTEPLSSVPTPKTLQDLEEALASKTRELESKFQDCRVADQMCQDLRLKLKDAEKQLNALRSHNASNESSVVNLQEELDLLSQCERGKSGRHSPAPAKGLSGYTLKDILVRAKTKENGKTTSEASSSEGMMNDEQVSISDAESKVRIKKTVRFSLLTVSLSLLKASLIPCIIKVLTFILVRRQALLTWSFRWQCEKLYMLWKCLFRQLGAITIHPTRICLILQPTKYHFN